MPMPGSPLRLVDVAAHAGVSLATASRALTGRDGVSAQVAAHVRQVASELGYVVNLHARTLAGGSTPTVGLIVHEIGDPYFAEIASGVLRLAGAEQRMVQICHSGGDPEVELRQVRMLIAHRVGVIIVAGSGYTDPALQAEAKAELAAFRKGGGRVAVIGRHNLGADAVVPDNQAGGHAVAEHLLSLGHRRIAVAAGPERLTTVADRMTGIAGALARAGLTSAESPVVRSDFTRDGGRLAADQILQRHPRTTAIIALNDVMAIGVLSALRARGVAVPAQMSVAGFDDVSVAADLGPSLTTIRLPMAQMGELALELALKPPLSRLRRKWTGHQLVVRESTGPAPAR